MKYSIRENSDGTYTLMRHGAPSKVNSGRPNSAELEFWFEIERLRGVEQHLLDEMAYLKGAIQERDQQSAREQELQDGVRSREQGWG